MVPDTRPASSANGGRRASNGSAEFSVVDVTSFFSATASGGVRTYLAAKARALGRAGVRHTIVVPGESSSVEEWNGSTLYRIRSPEVVFAPAYRLLVDWRGLEEIFDEVDPSVVEVGSPFTAPILVRRALAGRGVPMVGFYHADLVRTYAEPLVDRPLLSPLRVVLQMTARWMIRSIYNRFDATVCASPGVVRELRSLGVRRVHEVPLGVDLERFRPLADRPTPMTKIENGTPVAIYVGRICPEKRLDVLLEGHARLPQDDKPRLVLVGDGSIFTQVAGQAGDAGRVTMLPYTSDREELVRLYNAADYYVAPGPGETFGLAIGEALACGLPILCVERGAGPDRVAGSGASELYRHGDPDDCARAMRAMTRHLDPTARARARAHAERTLDWSLTFNRLLDLYRGLAASRITP